MITFNCANGNLPTLGCITNGQPSPLTSTNDYENGLTPPQGRQCQVTDETDGSFVSGDFTLALTYPHEREIDPPGGPFSSTAISWRATAAEVEAALEAVEDGSDKNVFGDVTVSRDVYQPPTEDRWSGQYQWTITFNTRPGNVPDIVPDASSAPAMATNDAAVTVTMVVGTTTDGNEVDGGFGLSFCPNGEIASCQNTANSYFDADLTANEFKHRFSEAFFYRGDATIEATAGASDVRAKSTDPAVDLTIDMDDWLHFDNHDYIVNVVEEDPASPNADGYTHTVGLTTAVENDVADGSYTATFGTSAVQVTRAGPTQAMGYAWEVTFSNKTAGGNQPDVESQGSILDGSGATIVISETQQGNQLTGTFTLSFVGGYLPAVRSTKPFTPPHSLRADTYGIPGLTTLTYKVRLQLRRNSGGTLTIRKIGDAPLGDSPDS